MLGHVLKLKIESQELPYDGHHQENLSNPKSELAQNCGPGARKMSRSWGEAQQAAKVCM